MQRHSCASLSSHGLLAHSLRIIFWRGVPEAFKGMVGRRRNERMSTYTVCLNPFSLERGCALTWFSGGKHRFASPAEFAAHAVWLMRGAVLGSCACKYCSKSSQSAITALMEEAASSMNVAAGSRVASTSYLRSENRALKRKRYYGEEPSSGSTESFTRRKV